MHISILRTDDVYPALAAIHGEYPEMFMRLLERADPGIRFSIYDVQRGEYPDDPAATDAYLITGSKSGVYDDKPWIATLADFIRARYAADQCLIGICFGHQLLAQALGGRAEKSTRGWGLGLQTYTVQQTPAWMDRAPALLQLLASHQDQVTQLPPGAQLIAASDFCPYAFFTLNHRVFAMQAHPEFTAGYAQDLLTLRRDTVGPALADSALATLSKPAASAQVAHWIIHFIRTSRAQHDATVSV